MTVSTRLRAQFRTLLLIALLAALFYAARQAGVMELQPGSYEAADGDSLRKGKMSVRLHGIDAPELAQDCRDAGARDYACGREAMKALAGLIRGRQVACTAIDEDRYDRQVAVCRAGEIELNREMVRLGWAIAYRRHSLAYVAAELEARRAKRGIWQGMFEVPEDWRERHPRGP